MPKYNQIIHKKIASGVQLDLHHLKMQKFIRNLEQIWGIVYYGLDNFFTVVVLVIERLYVLVTGLEVWLNIPSRFSDQIVVKGSGITVALVKIIPAFVVNFEIMVHSVPIFEFSGTENITLLIE